MIIYNARIRTLDGFGDFEDGFVEFDSKIRKIGSMQFCPPRSSDDYDAKGAFVFPGFIDPHSHLGVWGNGEGSEGDDGNEDTDPCTPHLRAVDMITATDLCFREAATAGVTTAVCGPGSSNAIAGDFLRF